MKAIARRLVACLIAPICLIARAEVIRLDDALSHTVPPNVQMQWQPLGSGAGMEAWVRVNLRIHTAPWAGVRGRVYMVLPRDEASTMAVNWQGTGRLLDGHMRSGERVLVFAGHLPTPMLEEQWLVRLRSAPDWQSSTRRLQFHFELEKD